jgi:hypothetical protein
MKRAPAVVGWFALAGLLGCGCACVAAGAVAGADRAGPPADYVGRYAPAHPSPMGALAIVLRRGRLTLAPLLERTTSVLVSVGRDSFRVEDRADRTFAFHRDARGRVDGVHTHDLGFEEPLAREPAGRWSAAERAVRGEARPAVRALLSQGADLEILCEFTERMAAVPALLPRAEAFAAALTGARPQSACAWARLGAAREALGRRRDAIAAYRRGLALDPGDEEGSGAALARLGATPASHP